LGYHATNIVLHIAEALLLWRILKILRISGAYLGAVLYAVHPVNVESVAWITQRKNLAAMLFFMLSVLFFLKTERSPSVPPENGRSERQPGGRFWYGASLLAFALGMLSKGSVAMLPFVLLGLVAWRRRLSWRDLAAALPFFTIAAVFTVVNVWFQRHGNAVEIRSAGAVERLLGAGNVVWFYLYKALLPLNLLFIYPQWAIDAGDLMWWLGPLAAVGVTVLLWRGRKGRLRPLLFAWGYFCAMLVPVMGLTDVYFMRYSLVADHYANLAIVGVVAAAAAGWAQWRAMAKSALPMLAAASVVGILACLTWGQCRMYRDSRTLYETTLAKNPGCWLARSNLALLLADAGDLRGAVAQGRQAVRLKPDLPEAHYNLGRALARAGAAPEAIAEYEEALRLRPDYAEAHYNLGNAFRGAGRIPEAIGQYEEAVRIKPDFSDARNNLANLMEMSGRTPDAIGQYEEALRIDPSDAEARNNLGNALAESGRLPEAIAQFEEALRLKPGFPEAENNLGMALADDGRPEEAVSHFEQAVRLKPDYAEAHQNLGIVLRGLGRNAEAERHIEEASRLAPK
jgi:tetratricopeptide (TPR) repeat protein